MIPATKRLSRAVRSFRPIEPETVGRLNELHAVISGLEHVDREQLRYGEAAEQPESCLCTPVHYAADLSHIPTRVLDVDYGCGDPTGYAEPGETVLDLGSGSGKHCFMIADKVGASGHVIGIDKTAQMLELSRGAIAEVTENLGYPEPNVEFRRGQIQNLTWNLEYLEQLVEEMDDYDYQNLARVLARLESRPLVESESIDLVVSNCVLNLVQDQLKGQLFAELFRVVRPGGRAVISDVVSTTDVPAKLKEDDGLWTGCMAGALRRDRFLQAFVDAGFGAVEELSADSWRSEQGIEFLAVTVIARRARPGETLDSRPIVFERPGRSGCGPSDNCC